MVEKQFELFTSGITKVIHKLHLNDEVKSLLQRVGGKIWVEFDPGSNAPSVRIVDDKGNFLCSAADFEKLAGYRRFLATAIKEAEKDSQTKERLVLTTNVFSILKKWNKDIPDVGLKQNVSKRIETEQLLKVVQKNLALVSNLPNDDYRKYIIETGECLQFVLVNEIINTYGNTAVVIADRYEALLSAHIPRWMYGKMTSNQWIGTERKEAKSLLFPRNNFLRGISFTTEELMTDGFIESNKPISKGAKLLENLLKTKFFAFMISPADKLKDKATQEIVWKEISSFDWVLPDPDQDPAEIIQPRLEGKAPPLLTLEKKQKGSKGMDTDLLRFKREIRNNLSQMNAHLAIVMRGIILVENPLEQFWQHIISGADQWELTPSKPLYKWIAEEDTGLTQFGKIVKLSDSAVNELLINIYLMKCGVANAKLHEKFLKELKEMLGGKEPTKKAATSLETAADEDAEPAAPNQTPTKDAKPVGRSIPHKVKYEELFKDNHVSEEDLELARKFLGVSSVKKKQKKTRMTARLMNKSLQKQLKVLETMENGLNIKIQVENWIETSFTTGKKVIQRVAVELVLAAAARENLLSLYDEDDYSSDEEEEDEDW